MAERPEPESKRPLSAWAFVGLCLALAVLLAMALAGLGSRWEWWHYWIGFGIFRYAFYGAFAAAGASLLGIVLSLWERAWRRAGWSLLGLALCIPMIWLPLDLWFRAQRVPRINDITTDTENPPAFVALLPLRKNAATPAAYGGQRIARLQKAAYPHLKPARFAAAPDQVFRHVLDTAHAMGWNIAAAVLKEGRIEATDTTLWFGFRDDIVVRIRPEEGGTRLDIRSKSRVGRSDIGKNAGRIEAFLKRMAEKIEKK